MKEQVKVREWKGWVVVNRNGHVFADTVSYYRRDAIKAYDRYELNAYKNDHKKNRVRVEKITITERSKRHEQ